MNMKQVPFVVIGGGIGGLAAALGIARTGRNVYVLEQAHVFSEVGAGLQLGPNALKMLDRLGVLEKVKEKAFFPRRLVLLDALTGEELASLDLGNMFQRKFHYPYIVTHRSDLLDALLEACHADSRITLMNNQEVVKIEQCGEKVRIECANQNMFFADAVIGADGIKSRTRGLIHQDTTICSEFVAYRGTIPVSEIERHEYFDDVVCWIAPYMHLVQYPIRRKELYNQVAVFKSDQYKGNPEAEDWGTPEELEQHFSRCCDTVRNALRHIQRGRRWPLFDREPIPNWTSGNITLLGDAAHPMLQYLAQGACQALEDAVLLSMKVSENPADICKAFLEYQQMRITRTSNVQRRARLFGEILHTEDKVAILLRNEILKNMKGTDYRYVEWLYGYDFPMMV
jgi:salicylate hydroxylase